MATVRLNRGEEDRLLRGHLWVYSNEVESVCGSFEPGDIVDVESHAGAFLGRGFINPHSRILVRLLTRGREEIDRNFFKSRISRAAEYRRRLGFSDSCRLVFAEADLLPALIVDRYGGYLSVQTLALGMDRRKQEIADILEELFSPDGIYERNDVQIREKEGLGKTKGFLRGSFDTTVPIRENGAVMYVDIANGQKTGYFLDQSENRAAIRPYVGGARVLDCFCHTGGFSVQAELYGAESVLAVDISAQALELAEKNAAANGFSHIVSTRRADVFDLLTGFRNSRERFDVVILDPPAFCKNRSAVEGALRGYKDINLRAMSIVNSGGFLISCSCSHHVHPDMFMDMLAEAARDAGRTARVAEIRAQSRDHPVLLGAEESQYLKCVIMQLF